jgi:DNA-binding CsgD family transcriptional regulator
MTAITEELLEKAGLTDEEKRAVRLTGIEGKTLGEAALTLGKTKGTISLQRKMGIQKLEAYDRGRELINDRIKPGNSRKSPKSYAPEEPKRTNRPSTSNGLEDKKVFLLIEKGHSLTQIVAKTGITHDRVYDISQGYIKLKQEDLTHPSLPRAMKEMLDRLNELGPLIDTASERTEIVYTYLSRNEDFLNWEKNMKNLAELEKSFQEYMRAEPS